MSYLIDGPGEGASSCGGNFFTFAVERTMLCAEVIP